MVRIAPVAFFLFITACPSSELSPFSQGLQVQSQLSFGDRGVGLEASIDTGISNLSARAVTITSAMITAGDPAQFEFRLLHAPSSLAPNASDLISVAFTAFAPMNVAVSSTLVLETDLGRVSVMLSGRGVPVIEVTPLALDYGDVYAGETSDAEVRITNLVDIPIRLRADPPSPSLEHGTFTPLMAINRTLAARSRLDLTMRYAPAPDPSSVAGGPDRSMWKISYCADDARCTVTVELSGWRRENTAGRLSVEPRQLDFGAVPVGESSRKSLTARNTGLQPIDITNIVASGFGTFGVVNGAPVTLASGDSVSIDVEFGPDTEESFTGELLIDSDDPIEPTVHVPLRGSGVAVPPCSFAIAPSELSFGSVEVMRTRTAGLVVENTGADPCSIRNVSITGDAFALVTPPAPMLAPGESTLLEVSYTPASLSGARGTLRFEINDPAQPMQEIELSGTGAGDTPVIYPDHVDFGRVAAGCASNARSVRIQNPTDDARTFDQISLSPDSSGDFSLSFLPLPLTIAAHDSVELTVTYRPSRATADAGTILVHERLLADPYQVQLVGREGARAEEQFTPPPLDKIDVVLAFDGSGSFFEENMALTNNLPAFLQFADASGADYQVNATVPFTTAQVLFDGMRELRSPALLAWNAGFLRRDASLAIIYASDHDDASLDPVSMYLDEARSIHGARNKNGAAIHAIAGDLPAGCAEAAASPRLAELASTSGGLFESVCADTATVYAELANAIFGPHVRYALENEPVSGTIEVVVDGARVDPFDANGQELWRYGPGNAVVFSPFAAPDGDVEVEISYATACH